MDLHTYDSKTLSFKKKTWRLDTASSINCISWSRNDRYVGTGNTDGSISLFNNVIHQWNKPLVRTHMTPNTTVTSMQHLPRNAGGLAAAYDDGAVVMWDSNTSKELCVFRNHTAPCTSIAISPLNTMLMVSAGLDRNIVIYDALTKK
jgi:WD40 repeat protein